MKFMVHLQIVTCNHLAQFKCRFPTNLMDGLFVCLTHRYNLRTIGPAQNFHLVKVGSIDAFWRIVSFNLNYHPVWYSGLHIVLPS